MVHLEDIDKNSKRIAIVLSILIGLCAIVIIYIVAVIPLINYLTKKTYIEIAVAPTTAKIYLNDQEYHNGTYEIEPGTYSVRIEADNFTSKQSEIKIVKRQDAQLVNYLLHKTEGLNYFLRSSSDLEILRRVNNDNDVTDFLQKYDNKLKIKNNLPILLNYYDESVSSVIQASITDGTDKAECKYAFCLYVDTSKAYEQRAREVIKAAGYSYDDYEVIYEKS